MKSVREAHSHYRRYSLSINARFDQCIVVQNQHLSSDIGLPKAQNICAAASALTLADVKDMSISNLYRRG